MARHNKTSQPHYPDECVRLGIKLYRYGKPYREIRDEMMSRGLPFPAQNALQTWSNGETIQSARILRDNPGLWPQEALCAVHS